ncbi:MAG: DUF882 domain-containing protein [Tannerellaceae bacterium]|jgi:uncharacterized protein YcbK (DUF882 family)|nr:DUF882 domain-containing protein [Tannerellaceae bacterium]
MNLSKDFTLEELVRSDTARRQGIDNTPTELVTAHLIILCHFLLQPVRDHIGKPIRVNSGYRSPKLNQAVSGVATSQHTEGKAVDITVPGMTACDLFDRIITMKGIEFDQIIQYKSFVHISFDFGKNRKQILYSKEVSEK